MKTCISLILTTVLVLTLLTGCSAGGNVSTTPDGSINGGSYAETRNGILAEPNQKDNGNGAYDNGTNGSGTYSNGANGSTNGSGAYNNGTNGSTNGSGTYSNDTNGSANGNGANGNDGFAGMNGLEDSANGQTGGNGMGAGSGR